jgi:hypothetical protein
MKIFNNTGYTDLLRYCLIVFVFMHGYLNSQPLLSPDDNVTIYTKTGNKYTSELVSIDDSNVVIYYQTVKRSGDFQIIRSIISKIIVDDNAIEHNKTKIEIYFKNKIIKGYAIKGIDFEKNLLYIVRINHNTNSEYKNIMDSIDLSDSTLSGIMIIPQTPVAKGLGKGLGYGSLVGGVSGALVGSMILGGTEDILFTALVGGLWFGIIGLGIGVIYVIANIHSDISIKASPELSYKLMNYILFPEFEVQRNE